jgi:hypothetical protein
MFLATNLILQMYYKPFEFETLNTFESINIYLMIFTLVNILLTNLNWNKGICWIALISTFVVPIIFYFYLSIKYLFPDRYEKKDEGCLSKVVYFVRRRLNIKFEQLEEENGIDQEKNFVFSEELNCPNDV